MAEKKVTAKELAAEKGAKRPEDKKAASTVKAQADGATIVAEVEGREWTISQDALDDFELLDDLAELENGNAVRLPSALKRLLGAEQYREAMAVLRNEQRSEERRRGTVESAGVDAGSRCFPGTGVQTCALPISGPPLLRRSRGASGRSPKMLWMTLSFWTTWQSLRTATLCACRPPCSLSLVLSSTVRLWRYCVTIRAGLRLRLAGSSCRTFSRALTLPDHVSLPLESAWRAVACGFPARVWLVFD